MQGCRFTWMQLRDLFCWKTFVLHDKIHGGCLMWISNVLTLSAMVLLKHVAGALGDPKCFYLAKYQNLGKVLLRIVKLHVGNTPISKRLIRKWKNTTSTILASWRQILSKIKVERKCERCVFRTGQYWSHQQESRLYFCVLCWTGSCVCDYLEPPWLKTGVKCGEITGPLLLREHAAGKDYP